MLSKKLMLPDEIKGAAPSRTRSLARTRDTIDGSRPIPRHDCRLRVTR